jgi:hypothetical protein
VASYAANGNERPSGRSACGSSGSTTGMSTGGKIPTKGMTPCGSACWTLVRDPTRTDYDSIGDRTIKPLIRLGLHEVSPRCCQAAVRDTARRETWDAFLTTGGRNPEHLTDL